GTKANPKYYRLRFEGEGLSLSYMITGVSIVNHVDAVLPTIEGDGENEVQQTIPETVAVFKSYGDFIGWEQDNPNIPNVIGTLPATAADASNKAVELKLEVEKLEGCHGARGIIWGMAGDVDDWSQGDSWWQDEAGAVDITQPGIYTVRFNLGKYHKATNKLVTSHIRFRLSTDDEQGIGAKVTMKVHNATIVDVASEDTEGSETQGSETEGSGSGDGNEGQGDGQEQNTPVNLLENVWYTNSYGGNYSEGTYTFSLQGDEGLYAKAINMENFSITDNGTYKLAFTMESSKSRTVKPVFQSRTPHDGNDSNQDYIYDGYCAGVDVNLEANVAKTLEYTFVIGEGEGEKSISNYIQFNIPVGKYSDNDDIAGTFKVSGVSLVKIV
ncbi:MAG: hypothetical protein IJM01_04965, partial [Eubacterium sp.]|nr:hypothetical protein [Eubacterium sp.]